MKAISLWQPWATLITIGAKRIETRSWATRYRGPLAIHAAKRWTGRQASLCGHGVFFEVLHTLPGYAPNRLGNAIQYWRPVFQFGYVVATCRLIACVRTEEILHNNLWVACVSPTKLPPYEQEFGDYTPRRWAWILDVVRPLPPITFRGGRGLFNVPMKGD
jgi:hypothetical protein